VPIWFNYSPLAPLINEYSDDGSRVLCTGTVSIATSGDYEVSLIGSRTSVELIRVAPLNSDGNLTEVQQETVGKLIDHMIAVLRFTYNPQAELLGFGENTLSIGTHDNDGKPSLRVQVNEFVAEAPPINAGNIRNVFIKSMNIRHLMKLLSDTQNPSIPLQYKFLSLYKVFELEFRQKKKWVGLNEFLKNYETEYRALKLSSRSLPNLLHELRDKCAHIKIGNEDDLGIVGLDGRDAKP
jgi:hypothetical protein